VAATLVSRRCQLRVAESYGMTGTVADSPYIRHGMRSSNSVAGAGARSAGHPGLIGITLAVILLGLASDKLDSMLSSTLNTLFGEWTSDLDLQWSLFVDHHLLAWQQWLPIIVFGLAAMLIFPCSLRDVFLLPNPTSWSWKRSAMVSIVVSVLLSACIFAGAWNAIDPAFHWGAMVGNIFSNMYEEVFFRGLLFGMLLRYSRRPWWAIVVTAAFFTAAHGQYSGWESFGFLFLALPFGWLTWKSGWIIWPYLVHMLVDWIVDPWIPPGYIWSYLPG
jgi:membrane protease YdiL (CAAX protease family)